MRRSVVGILALAFLAPGLLLTAAERPVDDLIRQLGSGSFAEREQAGKELVTLGPKALEPLRKAAESSDPEIARRAKECIPILERNIRISALLEEMKDPRASVRQKASYELYCFGRHAAAAVPAMVQALDDPDSIVQRRAAGTIVVATRDPKHPAIPKLLAMVRDRHRPEDDRHFLLQVLGTLGPDTPGLVDNFLAILETDSPSIKGVAAIELGAMRPKDKRVLEALLTALKSKDQRLQGSAAVALGCLGQEPKRCVPALMELLQRLRRNKEPADWLFYTLASFGEEAKPVVPVMVEVLKEKPFADNPARDVILLALQRMGSHASEAIPELQKINEKFPAFRGQNTKKELEKTIIAIGGVVP